MEPPDPPIDLSLLTPEQRMFMLRQVYATSFLGWLKNLLDGVPEDSVRADADAYSREAGRDAIDPLWPAVQVMGADDAITAFRTCCARSLARVTEELSPLPGADPSSDAVLRRMWGNDGRPTSQD